MGNASEDNVYTRFGKYMQELYRLPSGKLPSHKAICEEAKIDRNFYYRVKGNGFKGAPPYPKHVSALCNAIVLKESLKKKITAQEVLDGLIEAKLLPEGSKLELEVEESVIQEDDKKAKLAEYTREISQEMQDTLDVLKNIDEFAEYAKGKSSKDFGSWK